MRYISACILALRHWIVTLWRPEFKLFKCTALILLYSFRIVELQKIAWGFPTSRNKFYSFFILCTWFWLFHTVILLLGWLHGDACLSMEFAYHVGHHMPSLVKYHFFDTCSQYHSSHCCTVYTHSSRIYSVDGTPFYCNLIQLPYYIGAWRFYCTVLYNFICLMYYDFTRTVYEQLYYILPWPALIFPE